MAETVTGENILKAVEEEIRVAYEGTLKAVLMKSVLMISERRRWISARQAQISELEKLQVSMVRDFDAGEFSDNLLDSYAAKLDEIKGRTMSRAAAVKKNCSVKPVMTEDDYD